MRPSPVPAWRRPAVLLLLVLSAAAVLTRVYYWAFAQFPCNSDCAAAYLAATDMAAGNWRLAHWLWGSDPFWTSDLAVEAGLIKLLGDHPAIMVITAAIDWAGVVLLSVVACRAGGSKSTAAILPVAMILALPVLRNNPPMNLIAITPMHIGSILYILLMFLLTPKALRAGRAAVPALLGLAAATVLAVAGDPMALVLGAVPILAVTAIGAARHRDSRKVLVFVTVAGAAVLAKLGMILNQAFGGLTTLSTPTTFVSLEDLPRNVYLTLNSFLALTGSNFFGRTLGSAVLYLVRLPMLLAMGWALYVAAGRFARYLRGEQSHSEPDFLEQLLLVAAVINIVAGLASSWLVNIDTARYFIPAVVFLAILAGRTLTSARWFRIYASLALGATLLLLGLDYARVRLPATLALPDVEDLSAFLVQHHLTDGYASYWSASITTVATRGGARVRSIALCTDRIGCGDIYGKLSPVYLVAKTDWYSGFGRRDRAFFVVIDRTDAPQAVTEGAVTATFGAPSRQYDLPAYKIAVFDPPT